MFKKSKLISSGALALVILVMLFGCGNRSDSVNQPASSSDNAANQTADKTVTIGYVNWAEDVAITHLWKKVLENEGYNVKLVEGDEGTVFLGLSKGNIDIFLDTWLPVDIYPEQYKDTVVPVSNWFKGDAIVGLAVPTYLTEINSYEDLGKNGEMFNRQIIANEPSAGNVMVMKDTVMPEYNLNDFKLVTSSESAMISALQKAYDAKKPIAVTAWSPHWILAKYDLKFLPDPKNLNGPNGGKSIITSFANHEFPNKNKTVTEWFKNFEMTSEQMNTLELYIFHDKMSEEEAAEKWIKENESTVKKWLGKG